nr:uncharacterized protein LOC105845581 [Hydra vulgaris]
MKFFVQIIAACILASSVKSFGPRIKGRDDKLEINRLRDATQLYSLCIKDEKIPSDISSFCFCACWFRSDKAGCLLECEKSFRKLSLQ